MHKNEKKVLLAWQLVTNGYRHWAEKKMEERMGKAKEKGSMKERRNEKERYIIKRPEGESRRKKKIEKERKE